VPISVLRFDLRAPAFSPARAEDLYATALDMAAYADERGMDSVTVSEHHGVDDGFLPSPLVMAAAIAGRTKRIRIGISALLAPLYDPLKLAEDLAVLDIVSRGRVATTLGLGYRPEEYAAFGRDFAARGRILDECIETLLAAWRGEPFSYRGRTVRVTPRPVTEPHPLLLLGGQSKAAARRAARFGLPFQPASNDAEMIALYQSECARRGVTPFLLPPGSGEMIFVSRDPERTWRALGPHLLHDAASYAAWQPADQLESVVFTRATTLEALRADGPYRVLTPEQCVERARAQGALATFVLFPLCGGTPPALAWESLRLYGDEVLPRIAATTS
jgi:alkanesulfonate monooxygenase SsuD/methylene tetrahydromethanopterin reductase-like flavin-dependent oxidoreductase (luciferase family)